ncbi:hypothetical protein MASR2M79_03100 [Aminivibrio sp.]
MSAQGADSQLEDLAILMVAVSDNTAANMLIDRLGMDEINSTVHGLGLVDTILGGKMLGLKQKARAWRFYRWRCECASGRDALETRLPLSAKEGL